MKKENTLEVKKEIMKNLSGNDFTPQESEWDCLKLVIGDALTQEMDRKLIIEDDLKEAIWLAEKTGDKFVSEADGVLTTSMVKSALTYWVKYKELSPGIYEVLEAYNHRMRFSRED